MSIKVGDKFIIEIGEKFVGAESMQARYRIKGFDSLVFDKKGLDKLEPVEKAWENELEKAQSDAYEEGYDAGYKDGKSDATYNTELTDVLKAKERQEGYDVGYTQAIADYRKFERFFNSVGGIEVFEDIRNTDGTLSIDMILQYLPMPEIMARIKAYEEKKKAEEEFRVGDIVKFNEKCHDYNAKKDREYLVLHIFDNGLVTILYDNGDTGAAEISLLNKTGRHINETEQLLDKLRGEE